LPRPTPPLSPKGALLGAFSNRQPGYMFAPSLTLRRLLAAADQDMRDLIMFGTLTGLRPFEMRNLWHENIRDDDQGTSYLFIDKDVKGAKMARMPKPRSVPLCKEAEAIIERQFTAHPQSPFIFLSESGVPYTRYTLRDRFRRLAKSCGLKGFVPYSLRHTFASLQAAGGTETTSLAQLMGHSSVRTLQRYVVNTAKEHKEAMDRNETRLMGILRSPEGLETKSSQQLPPDLPPKNTAVANNRVGASQPL
jgi:integrase